MKILPALVAASLAIALSGPGFAQNHDRDRPAPNAPQAQQSGYGVWNKNWGDRPPASPSHWKKKDDWYRHVRACQQKYRSYNAHSDAYRLGAGKTRRCTL